MERDTKNWLLCGLRTPPPDTPHRRDGVAERAEREREREREESSTWPWSKIMLAIDEH